MGTVLLVLAVLVPAVLLGVFRRPGRHVPAGPAWLAEVHGWEHTVIGGATVVRGRWLGRAFVIVDAPRQPAGVLGRTQHVVTVSVATTWPWPALAIRRYGPWEKQLATLRGTGLRSANGEFNRSFAVDTADDALAYDVLDEPTMAWLLRDARTCRLPFRFTDDELRITHTGALPAHQLTDLLDYADDLLTHLHP